MDGRFVYDVARKGFTVLALCVCPLLFYVDAPFGRFTPTDSKCVWSMHSNLFLVDGIKSWIIMELVSPLSFGYTFVASPLCPARYASYAPKSIILAGLYLVHYLNRAILSPLRTPSRSKAHLAVPLSAVTFNIINGSLVGSYLSSPEAQAYLSGTRSWTWALGLGMWAVGFVGNIVHDEILLNLRRKANAHRDDTNKSANGKPAGEHYAIPYGLLYKYISYPNYFCEWIEWLGFAILAAPLPSTSFLMSPSTWLSTLSFTPTSIKSFAPTLTPPYIFLLAEVLLMLPRAYKGHQWYLHKFGASYPKERKVVVPFVF